MKQSLIALASVIAIVLAVIIPFSAAQSAQAESGCHVNIGLGGIGIVVCDGIVVDKLPLPTVKVTIPGPTIRLPGATRTVHVTAPARPRATRTIEVPGITQTHTVTVPGPTRTVSVAPRTITARPSALPSAAPTVTTTATATVTTTAPSATRTVGVPAPNHSTPDRDFTFFKGRTVIEKVGIGIGVLLILCGLILLAMYCGYILGYKERDDQEVGFLRALVNQTSLRR